MIFLKNNDWYKNEIIKKVKDMAKIGRDKNTKNKAKHSKLMAQKKNKKKAEEALRKERLKAIIKNTNKQKESD